MRPDYGTGLFFLPADACFEPLKSSGGRELPSRSPWKMHGQDVSNCVTAALWKGAMALNNAHAST